MSVTLAATRRSNAPATPMGCFVAANLGRTVDSGGDSKFIG